MVRRKLIRSQVDRLLTEYRIKLAPVPTTNIARALGVEVQEKPAEEELSGFLYRDRKRNHTVIGVNSTHHVNRRNFTVAHELGHFLLHDFDDLHIDRQFKVWLRSGASSLGTDIEEKEANLFAAELLMPVAFLAKDVEKIGTFDVVDDIKEVLDELAKRYGVSTQAMTFRLSYLGYLDQ